jgi:hypothetical protein
MDKENTSPPPLTNYNITNTLLTPYNSFINYIKSFSNPDEWTIQKFKYPFIITAIGAIYIRLTRKTFIKIGPRDANKKLIKGNWVSIAMSSDGKYITAVSSVSDSDIIDDALINACGIWVSQDYGQTWSKRFDPQTAFHKHDESYKVGVSFKKVVMSTNGNIQYVLASYKRTYTKDSAGNYILAPLPDGMQKTKDENNSYIFRSDNSGQSWRGVSVLSLAQSATVNDNHIYGSFILPCYSIACDETGEHAIILCNYALDNPDSPITEIRYANISIDNGDFKSYASSIQTDSGQQIRRYENTAYKKSSVDLSMSRKAIASIPNTNKKQFSVSQITYKEIAGFDSNNMPYTIDNIYKNTITTAIDWNDHLFPDNWNFAIGENNTRLNTNNSYKKCIMSYNGVNRVVLTIKDGIFCSIDSGTTYLKSTLNTTGLVLTDVAYSTANNDSIPQNNIYLVATNGTLYKSSDSGRNFQILQTHQINSYEESFHSVAVSSNEKTIIVGSKRGYMYKYGTILEGLFSYN